MHLDRAIPFHAQPAPLGRYVAYRELSPTMFTDELARRAIVGLAREHALHGAGPGATVRRTAFLRHRHWDPETGEQLPDTISVFVWADPPVTLSPCPDYQPRMPLPQATQGRNTGTVAPHPNHAGAE